MRMKTKTLVTTPLVTIGLYCGCIRVRRAVSDGNQDGRQWLELMDRSGHLGPTLNFSEPLLPGSFEQRKLSGQVFDSLTRAVIRAITKCWPRIHSPKLPQGS